MAGDLPNCKGYGSIGIVERKPKGDPMSGAPPAGIEACVVPPACKLALDETPEVSRAKNMNGEGPMAKGVDEGGCASELVEFINPGEAAARKGAKPGVVAVGAVAVVWEATCAKSFSREHFAGALARP